MQSGKKWFVPTNTRKWLLLAAGWMEKEELAGFPSRPVIHQPMCKVRDVFVGKNKRITYSRFYQICKNNIAFFANIVYDLHLDK
jgi:hypothetical protein